MRVNETEPLINLALNPQAEVDLLLKEAQSDLELILDKTWRFLHSQLDVNTTLPADRLRQDDAYGHVRSTTTSPTNIGLALTAITAADHQDLFPNHTAQLTEGLIASITDMKKFEGFLANWYQSDTGQLVTEWPGSGRSIKPFVSSVDNAWLASGLLLAQERFPAVKQQAASLLQEMDFRRFFDSTENAFFGGCSPQDSAQKYWIYPAEFLSESRILYHVALLLDQISTAEYLQFMDNFPERTYGGSMFEALMPALLVEENICSDSACSVFQQLVAEQIERGKLDGGCWGFSPCDSPEEQGQARYREFGVGGAYDQQPGPTVVTPHAVLLAFEHAPYESLSALRRMVVDLQLWCPENGLQDAVNVATKKTSGSWLFLDQSMIFLSLANVLDNNWLKNQLSAEIERKVSSSLPQPLAQPAR